MSLIECSPTHSKPPTKIAKLEIPAGQKQITETRPISSPQPNIVQRIKYVLAEDKTQHQTGSRKPYCEVSHNFTVFNLKNGEILVVNALLNKICSWQPTPIPYICFPVKTDVDQRTALNRTGILLSSLYQLPKCVIGIKIDVENCQERDSQFQHLTVLRRAIWNFLATEIAHMPPYLRQFLKAELNLSHFTIQQQISSQTTSANNFKFPQYSEIKVK